MKKRIFALLAATVMLFAAIMLPSCKQKQEGQASSDVSSAPTAKEIFENALKSKFIIDENSVLITKLKELSGLEIKDVSGVMNAKVTKLTFGEFDLSGVGSITLDGNVAYDADSKRTNGNFVLDVMGEKPAVAFTADESGAYITDYFGLNEKPLYIDPEKQLDKLDREKPTRIVNALKAYAEIYSHVKASAEAVIDADIEESAFVSSEKEVQLGTSFYTNANEITLTLQGEKARAISAKLIDEFLKSEDIKALLGSDFDKNELLANVENVKELRMINTVYNGETVAFDIGLDAENEEGSESYLLKSILIAGNYMSALGTTDENGDYDRAVEFAYEGEAEAGKHGITAEVTKDGSTFNALTAHLTEQNGKYNSDITVSTDGATFTNIKLAFEGDAKSGSIAVSEVSSTNAEGVTEKIPVIFNIEYKTENETLTVNSLVNVKINENISIDTESVFTGEQKDTTVEAVNDYIPVEEYDFDASKLQFAFKYPKINAFLLMYEIQSK